MKYLNNYLDNASTTPLSEEMKEYLISMLDVYGNPSSAHSEGVRANGLIQGVRDRVAKFINAETYDNIYFTSSGSASNALGIQGYAIENKCTILYSPVVHKSILKTIKNLEKYYRIESKSLKVDKYGNIDIDNLNLLINSNYTPKLVVIEYANSEFGTIQDIEIIERIVHNQKHNCNRLFVDCTGSISTIPLDVLKLKLDIVSFSAHKIGALKGVGVLYKKEDVKLAPLVCGTQEQGLFAGTENLLGVLSLGKAIELIKYNKTASRRDFVWENLKGIKGVSLVGTKLTENRLINNLYICIKGVKSSDVAAMLDDIYKIQISTGSACNSGETLPSPAVLAIGLTEEEANSCIRISFSGNEDIDNLREFCTNLNNIVKMLRTK